MVYISYFRPRVLMSRYIMGFYKYLNYIFILVGCIVAIYAQAEKEQNTLILVLGIVLLMFGLFRVYSTIPNKKKEDEDGEI